ncbi:MAG: DNA photolyase [Desulfobacterales bacterium]|nr:MAG: DNA photolyase [Desulfobacterales bacterium]
MRNASTGNKKIVISASRRTDIPGHYTPWFMECIRNKRFTVTNPFNRTAKTVLASPEHVHTIVFWSKNYGPFMDLDAHKRLTDIGYNLFFNFTVNTENPLLEPGIPPLAQRLKQVAQLTRDSPPDTIIWRFDPICFFSVNGQQTNNLKGFAAIADAMADSGITRCVSSFYDPYHKVDRRIKRLAMQGGPMIKFIEPPVTVQKRVIEKMANHLRTKNISLYLCCEAGLMLTLGEIPNLKPNACIDGTRYQTLFGGSLETRPDYGQRRTLGCRCTKSVDVGDYNHHPCPHNCLFCYARTKPSP